MYSRISAWKQRLDKQKAGLNWLKFIDLGEFINRQSKEEAEKVRQTAVEKAIADTWEGAHIIKTQAVKEAVEKTQAQHEKQIRRLAKQHDRAIKVCAL